MVMQRGVSLTDLETGARGATFDTTSKGFREKGQQDQQDFPHRRGGGLCDRYRLLLFAIMRAAAGAGPRQIALFSQPLRDVRRRVSDYDIRTGTPHAQAGSPLSRLSHRSSPSQPPLSSWNIPR
jgi:hypothetical protein